MLYDTFKKLPRKSELRRKIFRAARLGLRPSPSGIDAGSAVRAIDAARAVRQGWTDSTDDFAVTVRAAWDAR